MAKSTRPAAAKAKKATAGKAKTKSDRTSISPQKQEFASAGRTISIEACKQWSVFKTRANKIASYLAEKGCDAVVEINKEKPGKGNFIVRVDGKEEPVLSLLGMARPFKDLKALDMDDIGKMVIDALDESKK